MPKRPIYYDTETTGTKPGKDRIVEIAAYDPYADRSFVEFVNPQMPIPPESSAIHNITDDMVQDAPAFDVIGKRFIEFCSGDVVLIAHNNDAFDKIFLEEECKRSGLDIPDWPYIDTLKWARKYRTDLPRHSLQHLREVFGIPPNNAHRALDDVMILHEVFSRLIDDLSMETILELLNQGPPILRTMPFGKHRGKPLSEVPKSYIGWLKEKGVLEKPENELLRQSLEKLQII
ncbi:MAG: DUF3820 family protein [Simkaniaceae bacterium]